MSLTHEQIHRLENKISAILERGFVRPPQPGDRAFDKADATQAAHDVAEMLLTDYAMEDRDSLLEEMGTAESMREAVKNMRRLLSCPVSPFEMVLRGGVSPAVQAAGVGGGMGEEVR